MVLNDSGEGAALLQILRGLGGDELIDPVVTMPHHRIAEHLGHLLERLLRLRSRVGHRAVVC